MWIPVSINPPPMDTKVIIRGGDPESRKYGISLYSKNGFEPVNVRSTCYGPGKEQFDFMVTDWKPISNIE